MKTAQMYEKEQSEMLSKILKQEREIMRLRIEIDEEKKSITNQQHLRDSEMLKWLFDENNLNAHVSLPKACWKRTTNFRTAIRRAMEIKEK